MNNSMLQIMPLQPFAASNCMRLHLDTYVASRIIATFQIDHAT